MIVLFGIQYFSTFNHQGISMFYGKALHIAGRTLVDGATLAELRQASRDLRAMTPNSALADLVDAKIKAIESHNGRSKPE